MPPTRMVSCSRAPTRRCVSSCRAIPHLVRLPTSALIFRENGMEVATIGPDNKIELKPITLGRNLGTEVEVLKGLLLTDRVVNSPPGLAFGRGHSAHRRSTVEWRQQYGAVSQNGERGLGGGAGIETLANINIATRHENRSGTAFDP